MAFTYDWTMMYAMHAALRRELERIARVTARTGDVARYMPWMLEGAAPDVTAAVLGQLPPPVQQAYRDQWQPAYAKLELWA